MGVYGVCGHITPAGPYQFQVSVEGSTVPHVLYLLLSILTCGLWLVVWLIHVSMQKAPSLHVVRVDEYGAVWFDGTVWWPPPAGDGPRPATGRSAQGTSCPQ